MFALLLFNLVEWRQDLFPDLGLPRWVVHGPIVTLQLSASPRRSLLHPLHPSLVSQYVSVLRSSTSSLWSHSVWHCRFAQCLYSFASSRSKSRLHLYRLKGAVLVQFLQSCQRRRSLQHLLFSEVLDPVLALQFQALGRDLAPAAIRNQDRESRSPEKLWTHHCNSRKSQSVTLMERTHLNMLCLYWCFQYRQRQELIIASCHKPDYRQQIWLPFEEIETWTNDQDMLILHILAVVLLKHMLFCLHLLKCYHHLLKWNHLDHLEVLVFAFDGDYHLNYYRYCYQILGQLPPIVSYHP